MVGHSFFFMFVNLMSIYLLCISLMFMDLMLIDLMLINLMPITLMRIIIMLNSLTLILNLGVPPIELTFGSILKLI